jgi:tripartite-type tricarboxylate transporter receptor subunit TctC
VKTHPHRVAAGVTILAAFFASAFAPPLAAQDYPKKPIHIISPFGTGGATDVMARLIGQKITESWGQQVVVENRTGAGGNIGMDAVAKSAPDGYTLAMMNNATMTNIALGGRMPFDFFRDFTGIGLVASTPMMLVSQPSLKAASLSELTAFLRANPDRLSYGSCNQNGTQHFATELYKSQANVFVMHAPYRSCVLAMTDLLGGQIELAMVSTNVAIPQMRAGKVRVFGITTKTRSPSAPDVPSFRESGVPELRDYDVDIWYGLVAPAAIPRPVVEKLRAEVRRILETADVKQRMTSAFIDEMAGDGDELMAQARADLEKFRRVVKFAGLKPE